MADTVRPGEAARLLGTTPPTVRLMLERGVLSGRQDQHGTRLWWVVDTSSIDAYLSAHGSFKRQTSKSRLEAIEEELVALRETIAAPGQGKISSSEAVRVERERDDLRATVITLQDALARARSAAELQRDAERERATVIEHLQAALAASERADALRRQAFAELDEAVAAAAFPGHPGGLAPGGPSEK